MMTIHFRSENHKQRFTSAIQDIGKFDDGLIDREYGTALYLLTFDNDLWELAKKYVSQSGIRFDHIIEKNIYSSGEATLIKLAANLFYSSEPFESIRVQPVEFVWLGEPFFMLAMNALNLRYYGMKLSDLHSVNS